MHWDYSWPLSWLFVALVYLTPLLITVDTGAAVKNTGNKGQANFVWPILLYKKNKKGRKGNKKLRYKKKN